MPIQMDGHPSKMCSAAARPLEDFDFRARGSDCRTSRARTDRRATLAVVLVAAAACSPASDALTPSPGRSSRPPGGPTAAPSTGPEAPVRWERWGELASWRVAIERSPSQHLAVDHEADTLTNEAAAAYPGLGPARRLGVGAVLAQRLYAPGAAAPDVVFVMERRVMTDETNGAGWEYLMLDSQGFITERGALESCARCHAEAPHDGLFGRAK
jgi:hypothetical protein